MSIHFDQHLLRDFDAAIDREWLITNGIGGYAASSLLGAHTRRYHAMLVAATEGLQRVVTFSRADAIALYKGRTYDLTTAYFRGGTVQPMGYLNLHSFRLDGTVPVWTWQLDDATIEQRVVLAWEQNAVYVVFRLLQATEPLTLRVRLLHTIRDHHDETKHDWRPQVTDMGGYYRIARDEQGFFLRADEAQSWTPNAAWLKGIFWLEEQWRGKIDHESLFQFGDYTIELTEGQEWQVSATTEPDSRVILSRRWNEVQQQRAARDESLLQSALPHLGPDAPAWIRQLVLAADQFIITVERGGPQRTILAGYPWFTDWGRDTMIALPGLCLATGRHDDARAILRAFARYVDQGMLPNRFPDEGETPEYNTADATLWFFDAIGQTWQATGDATLLRDLYPVLEEIVHWHQRGTRYNIHLDSDGLLVAGTEGTQLTWMDVKIDDFVPTPRHGKAVELSALWYNALRWMAHFAEAQGLDPSQWEHMAQQTQHGFARFWNPETGYLFDVLDRDGQNDPSLRPNQLFALSLTHPILTDPRQAGSILAACAEHLLTPVGLRSLSPEHPDYKGQHGGPREEFDRAYHNGTVWGWLIGPYLRALKNQGASADEIRAHLEGMRQHLHDGAVGTIAEIFDGDPPHHPRGCYAQAWSVSEVLALWWETRKNDADTIPSL
jgi:predicted glycogen debranching enzyme